MDGAGKNAFYALALLFIVFRLVLVLTLIVARSFRVRALPGSLGGTCRARNRHTYIANMAPPDVLYDNADVV